MAVNFAQWGNDLYTGRRSYDIVGRRRTWFTISGVLVVLSAILLIWPGLEPGIEFRGGSEFTVSNVKDADQDAATEAVTSVAPEEVPRVTSVGSSTLRIQTSTLTNDQVEQVRTALEQTFDVTEDDVASSFIGPTWGKDVSNKAITSLIVFLVLVTVVMTIYFRNWRMAIAALIALFHDLIITAGVYAAVGWEVTPATVIGFLTILDLRHRRGVRQGAREHRRDHRPDPGHLRRAREPRGQPDPGPLDQHLGRGAAAGRGDPVHRGLRARCGHAARHRARAVRRHDRRRVLLDLPGDAARGRLPQR
jgi:hypothetical protein